MGFHLGQTGGLSIPRTPALCYSRRCYKRPERMDREFDDEHRVAEPVRVGEGKLGRSVEQHEVVFILSEPFRNLASDSGFERKKD